MTNKLPIGAARDIAKSYGWDQVIIVARKAGDDGREHVVTYGEGSAHCEAAARAGMAIKHHLMAWPNALHDSTLRVLGIRRAPRDQRAVILDLSETPTNTGLRMIYELLRPRTYSPSEIDEGR